MQGKHIVAFVIGGITRSEMRVAHKLSTKLGREVLLGSTSCDTPTTFLRSLQVGCCFVFIAAHMHLYVRWHEPRPTRVSIMHGQTSSQYGATVRCSAAGTICGPYPDCDCIDNTYQGSTTILNDMPFVKSMQHRHAAGMMEVTTIHNALDFML